MHVSANRQNVPHSSVDVRKRKIRKREVAGLLFYIDANLEEEYNYFNWLNEKEDDRYEQG